MGIYDTFFLYFKAQDPSPGNNAVQLLGLPFLSISLMKYSFSGIPGGSRSCHLNNQHQPSLHIFVAELSTLEILPRTLIYFY